MAFTCSPFPRKMQLLIVRTMCLHIEFTQIFTKLILMKLSIQQISVSEFKIVFSKLKSADKKWFISILHNLKEYTFHIIIGANKEVLGFCAIKVVNRLNVEISFYIKPQYRNNSFGSSFVAYILKKIPISFFQVSNYNGSAILFFDKLVEKNELICSCNAPRI
jgi:hypothetical protein